MRFLLSRKFKPSALLFSASLAYCDMTLACSCIDTTWTTKINGYFISPQLLPQNAKGVLFFRLPSNFHRDIGNGYRLVGRLPEPLDHTSFSLRDLDQRSINHEKIKYQIRKLDTPPLQISANNHAPAQKITYLYIDDQNYAHCLSAANAEELSCQFLKQAELIESWLKQGKLRDVSEGIAYEAGLFRIEPQIDFEPGHEYKITLNSLLKAYSNSAKYILPEYLSFKIGPGLVHAEKPKFEILKSSDAYLDKLAIPMGGSCDDVKSMLIQKIQFHVPDEYSSYYHAFKFFIYTKDKDEEMFFYAPYKAGLCQVLGFGSNTLGHGKELVYTYWHPTRTRKIVARGLGGFLEVDDTWHSTRDLEIEFNPAAVNAGP